MASKSCVMINFGSAADMRLLLLASLLALATWQDLRTRRIPNRLVVSGAMAALAMHLIERWQGGGSVLGGLILSTAGFLTGLLMLLPFYLMRTMGAGDVKLMAMVGAFIGPLAVVGASLLTMLAGGIIALLLALRSRQLGKVMGNVLQIVWSWALGNASAEVRPEGKNIAPSAYFPYAAAIATGTLLQLALTGTSAWRLFW